MFYTLRIHIIHLASEAIGSPARVHPAIPPKMLIGLRPCSFNMLAARLPCVPVLHRSAAQDDDPSILGHFIDVRLKMISEM